MLERPDAADLLATARDVLLGELLPQLPEVARFQARMVANAMGIAERLVAGRDAPDLPLPAGQDVHHVPGDLSGLAQAIREGRHDPGTAGHDEVRTYLRAMTRWRCEVSAPRVVQAHGSGDAARRTS